LIERQLTHNQPIEIPANIRNALQKLFFNTEIDSRVGLGWAGLAQLRLYSLNK
jgi:hypothetical protein